VSRGLQAALRTGILEEGHAVVQDEAAALVVTEALAPKRGETLLDTCAAPGGKALFAAACMHTERSLVSEQPPSATPLHTSEGGLVVALDVSASRLRLLQRTVALWGLEDLFVIGSCDLRIAASHRYATHMPSYPSLRRDVSKPECMHAGNWCVCVCLQTKWPSSNQAYFGLLTLYVTHGDVCRGLDLGQCDVFSGDVHNTLLLDVLQRISSQNRSPSADARSYESEGGMGNEIGQRSKQGGLQFDKVPS
jgi:hypothetical protein